MAEIIYMLLGLCFILGFGILMYFFTRMLEEKIDKFLTSWAMKKMLPKRQVINGLLYDTEKAKIVFKDSNTIYYKTTNENCFMVSPYLDGIKPITVTYLKEKYVGTDINGYKEMFGEPEEA